MKLTSKIISVPESTSQGTMGNNEGTQGISGQQMSPLVPMTNSRDVHTTRSQTTSPASMSQSLLALLNKKDNYAAEAPNGVIIAWIQVLGCSLVFMNNWGLACSFGVYQAYYQLPT